MNLLGKIRASTRKGIGHETAIRGIQYCHALALLTLAVGCASTEQTEALLSEQALEPSTQPTRCSGNFYHINR
jgi:hypothetical protein